MREQRGPSEKYNVNETKDQPTEWQAEKNVAVARPITDWAPAEEISWAATKDIWAIPQIATIS